jgi:dolichol kinase
MLGLLISYGFIGALVGAAFLLSKLPFISSEGARKFLHISVVHWILLAPLLFDSWRIAIIVPITFIFINAFVARHQILTFMKPRHGLSEYGSVLYAVSLAFLTFFLFRDSMQRVVFFAALTMGYGDGVSGLAGTFFGRIKIYRDKTLIGLSTMFAITFLIGLILFPTQIPTVLFIAGAAAFTELYFFRGLDNISVPLIVLILGVMFL